MRNRTYAVAMTDPQLSNNNNANNNNNTSTTNNNNNNDGEPKYLHKKFKKMATTEVATKPVASEVGGATVVSAKKDCSREIGKTDEPEAEAVLSAEGGKKSHMCPYCKMSCTKPSVLQKHIRAHTNERPFPCILCGFAFKTRSNLYKHCRSRAHILKSEGGDANKVSEDSDISLSDSASNGTGTPPPGVGPNPSCGTASTTTSTTPTPCSTPSLPRTVKTGKIYKPKFHTALQSVAQQEEPLAAPPGGSSPSFSPKPNAEQVQERIDRIITDNQMIVDDVNPLLHKLKRQVESKQGEQPLNLTTEDSAVVPRKRSHADSFPQQNGCGNELVKSDLEDLEENLDAHQRFYCKGSPGPCPRKVNFHLDLDKRDDLDSKSDYYNGLQPLPSPGPLLGNTRLVDPYASSSPKKPRPESVPTSLRSLEELSKYPRPNSLQMFGGEVRILDNSGETKTMRIDPCKTKSPSPNEPPHSGKSPNASGTTSVVVRSGLHSGGMMVHKSPPNEAGASASPAISLPNTPKIVPNISKPNLAPSLSCYNYLEPHINPLTSITAYNPLTLPQAGLASILHAGKFIPYVPGMPGPHSLTEAPPVDISANLMVDASYKVIPGMPGLHVMPQPLDLASPVAKAPPGQQPLDLASPPKEPKPGFVPTKLQASTDDKPPSLLHKNHLHPSDPKNYKGSSPSDPWDKQNSFYPNPKPNGLPEMNPRTSPFNKAIKFSPRVISSEVNPRKRPASWQIEDSERLKGDVTECSKPTIDGAVAESFDRPKTPEEQEIRRKETSTKFLRPTSLPLKPGTFVPKKQLGITPTSNTIPPLVSPETPRPKKSYGQLYLNGHAYTYLGMKCSTRLFYCTLNRPQPMYVSHQQGLSMYSNWKINMESPSESDMGHYDSRNRDGKYTVAAIKLEFTMTHSSHRPSSPGNMVGGGTESEEKERTKRVKVCDGGFESNEDYTYVRGRGRGRYVCNSCGIRCKKPSMLKKHIRTHTDVRPYTCKHCSFSFKTKGNLTKHMKSKAHYKKCVELNIVPVPTVVCDDNIDKEALARLTVFGENAEESSEEEDESEGDDSEEQESEKEESEKEAAQGLLIMHNQNSPYKNIPGLLPSGPPFFYPYKHNLPNSVTTVTSSATCTTVQSGATCSVQSATVIQSEHSNRYYFPSSRNAAEDLKSGFSSEEGREEGEVREEGEEGEAKSQGTGSQPIDLTTKQMIASPIPQRAMPADILTPVSEPVLLQTLVQTMERLPIQGSREWKPEAQEGHMLQAYLTERYVMDSKIKQQYRVGNSKLENPAKPKDVYLKHSAISRPSDVNGVVTVSYTNSTRMQQPPHDSRLKAPTFSPDDAQFDLKKKGSDARAEPAKPFFEPANYSVDLTRPADPEPPKKSYNLLVPANCQVASSPSPDAIGAPLPDPQPTLTQRANNADYAKVAPFHGTDARYLFRPEQPSFPIPPPGDRSAAAEPAEAPSDISLAIKHSVARKMVVGSPGFRPETPPQANKPQAIVKPHFLQNSATPAPNYVSVTEDGRSVCGICNKVFSKSSQLKLHINIHYFERPFKCECCGKSFRTKGHLTKHERSVSHHNKVSMTSTFGAATTSNPRPFNCADCKVAFRIHGHLAKHLRSKMHIMRLECLGKLPFGCYAEMERSGVNLNDIDTTDCDNSLTSLQMLAQRMYENDPSKVKSWDAETSRSQSAVSGGETSSDEGESLSQNPGVFRPYNAIPEDSPRPNSQQSNGAAPPAENGDSGPVRCPICALSLPSLSDLQMHNFVEHNEQENGPAEKT